jgi:hypothetical protein
VIPDEAVEAAARKRYMRVDPKDIPRVAPEGYTLAVWFLPFTRRFALTWWVDENGKIGKREQAPRRSRTSLYRRR